MFHCAIRKYGEDAFTWEIIDTAMTEDELNEKEKYWISSHDSFNNGYNMTEGGDGFSRITGENHPSATITEKQAIAIYTSGLSQREIAKLFNVSESVVHNIKRKKAWKSVTDKLTQFIITEQQIIDMYLSPMDAEHLAKEYFCSIDFADKVKKGIYYSELTKRFG